MSNIAAAIITIGDELLIGQVVDTNSAWIAKELNKMGIDVLRRVAVGDNKDAILHALDAELGSASLVIVTGGLGPTADDITKPLLNEYFSGHMVVNERVLEHVKSLFARRNRPFVERNMKQAEVPDTCSILFNKMGTAPGMWFEKNGKVVIALPGVPFEMVSIMEDEALPRIKQQFFSDAIIHRSIITAGEGESFIADKIQDLEEALPPHIKLAYLPGAGMVRLRLTGRGADAVGLENELNKWQTLFADRLGKIVVATEDIPIEAAVKKWFIKHHLTLGLAESCTGGYMSHLITQFPGASNFFKGCIVCYHPDVKEQILGVHHTTIEKFGVVSEETATEMAKGAMNALDADYGFGITGLLSTGGESDRVPVGTVWMAVANEQKVKTKVFHFTNDRLRNKEMAMSMALLMIWKFINEIE